jgi:hypothetical protein
MLHEAQSMLDASTLSVEANSAAEDLSCICWIASRTHCIDARSQLPVSAACEVLTP